MRPALLSLILILVFCVLMGCGPGGPATHPVSGSVSLDGTPIPDGDIIFTDPTGAATSGMGKITDGKYTANITAGKKRVEIRASKMMPFPAGQVGAMGEKEGPQDYIPKKYNDQSELTMDVKAGTNTQDFPLVSK
jgi:hypothetical protein